MIENLIVALFTTKGFFSLLQVLVTVIIVLYNFYAFLIVRQVKLLNAGFQTTAARMFSVIGYIHLLGSLTITVIAIILLL